ncbi:hypothetical protein EXU85_34870 [Spirosoma sp. KCTC 42546]|uniref:hypothetical protein n=1 Tax=Spirosoma sp. KCTC 42546 TaxID=2520506 RepID=UPI001156D194|nr:hypothetical protein [Spirosoma sp. KCTC 42546]QDK83507.1 hypothetical protein EXU85_34870 [Spirosoma sp. KCTC 42546]
MKTITCLFFCLLAAFAHAQTEPTKTSPWRTTVQMGIQAGRVRPDQPNVYPYYGDYIYSPNYYNYSPIRGEGNRIGLTIHAFMGYTLRPQLVTGLSLGVDYYNNSAFLPIAAAIQGDLFGRTKRLTPFYSLESGYAIAGPNPHGSELKGGWLWSPGLGLRINKGNGTGFLISAGYKHQEAKQVAAVDGVQVLSQIETRSYNRLFFRMGFSF